MNSAELIYMDYSNIFQHYELLVFGPGGTTAKAHLTIDTPHFSSSMISMAMPRDDKRVAFILNDQLHVYELGSLYDLETRPIRKVMLDQTGSCPIRSSPMLAQGHYIERTVEFSVEGKNLLVATFLGQSSHFEVWDCDVEPWRVASSRSFQSVGHHLLLCELCYAR